MQKAWLVEHHSKSGMFQNDLRNQCNEVLFGSFAKFHVESNT